jgi:methylenetetrahydrofolate dehydrogenase (NADP+)/methenyltetrahydrofolate cyclohydrolase
VLVLDGKLVSQIVKAEVEKKVKEFHEIYRRTPGLGVVIVGDDPASHVYVKNKENACKQVGMHSIRWDLPIDSSEDEILKAVYQMNENPEVDAFLVQMPLPRHINTEKILDSISPLKDADGLHPANLGLLWANRPLVVPCTPFGVMKILEHYQIRVSGKHCVVVGRSQIVGRPMAHLLTQADGTVTVVHSRTTDMYEFTRKADLIVVAAGKKFLLGRDDFKKGVVVVDVGIHGSGQGKPGKISGDVNMEGLEDWAEAVTPVPGGVGPMTIACLLENTLKLAQHREMICPKK